MLTVMVMVVGEEDTEVAERKTTERKKKEIIFSVFLLFISSAEFVLLQGEISPLIISSAKQSRNETNE